MLALRVPYLYVKGLAVIFSSRKLLLLFLIPWLLGVVFFIIAASVFFHYHSEIVGLIFWNSEAWYHYFFDVITVLLECAAASVIGIVGSLVLAEVYIERLVHAFYERKGVALNELTGGRTVFESLRFAIIDNVKRLFYIASISLLIFILGWFPPFLLLVLFLSFLVAGFDGMDLPLQLRGLTIRERLRFARVHWTTTLILGCCYSMTLVVPLLGIVALPLSYFVAVELDCASGDGVLKA